MKLADNTEKLSPLFADCSKLIDTKSGGVIRLSDTTSQLPGLYDCIWIIKRPARKNPDGLLLRLTDIGLGEGQYNMLLILINSFRIRIFLDPETVISSILYPFSYLGYKIGLLIYNYYNWTSYQR